MQPWEKTQIAMAYGGLLAGAVMVIRVVLVLILPLGPANATGVAEYYAEAIEKKIHACEFEDLPIWFDRLGALGSGSVPGLLKLAASDDQAVQLAMGNVFVRLELKAATADWLARQADGSDEGEFEVPRLAWLRPVLAQLSHSRSSSVRAYYLPDVAWHVPGGIDLTIAATSDSSQVVRRAAFNLLARNEERVTPRLATAVMTGLKDEEASVRTAAAYAAGALKVRAALPILLELLSDDDPAGRAVIDVVYSDPRQAERDPWMESAVNQYVVHAIQEVTGRDFGFVSCYDSGEDMPEIIERIRTYAAMYRVLGGADGGAGEPGL